MSNLNKHLGITSFLVIGLTFWAFILPIFAKADKSLVERDAPEVLNQFIGGYRCSIQKYPYIVSLQHPMKRGGHFCAGTLLSEHWVLTAKRCLGDMVCKDPRNFTVVAGKEIANNVFEEPNAKNFQRAEVFQCIPHRKHVSKADIGLIMLKTPIRAAENIKFVKLPRYDTRMTVMTFTEALKSTCLKEQGRLAGWGDQAGIRRRKDIPKDAPPEPFNPYLKCIDLPLVPLNECQSIIPQRIIISPTFLCVYRKDGGSCSGDLGDPFICNGYQYGIASFTKGCGKVPYPRKLTSVWHFEKFINRTIEDNYRHNCLFFDNCRDDQKSTSSLKLISQAVVIIVKLTYILVWYSVTFL